FTASNSITHDLLHDSLAGIEIEMVPAASSAAGALKYRHFEWDAACARLGCDAAFGFNYWIPTALPQVTYHINVIPFLPWKERCVAVGWMRAMIQNHYAQHALRLSAINLFESNHIRDLAVHA